MMHRRTLSTTGSAVSKSPPGRPPRSPAAALLATSTAPAAAPTSGTRVASRSTRAAPSRSSRCVSRAPVPPRRAIPQTAQHPPRTRRRCIAP
eukprot:scaffold51081_cov53-Phaeocystis_antarctica.AAC.2